jgi:uncharacterized membrane protein (DUF485 family)
LAVSFAASRPTCARIKRGFYVRQRIDTQEEFNEVLSQKLVGAAIAISIIGVTLYFAWPLILLLGKRMRDARTGILVNVAT